MSDEYTNPEEILNDDDNGAAPIQEPTADDDYAEPDAKVAMPYEQAASDVAKHQLPGMYRR